MEEEEEKEKETTSNIQSQEEEEQQQEDDDEIEEDIGRPRAVFRKLCKHREAYASLAAAFSAVSVGALVSWTSGASPGLVESQRRMPYEVTNLEFNLSISLLPVGAALGAMFSGSFAQSLGRKLALQCMALPCVLSWVMLLLGNSIWWLYAARILGGMAMGIVYTIAIVYISEISRPWTRGTCCALVQIGFTFGVLYTCAINVLANSRFHPVTEACLPLPFVAVLLMQLVPETPQFFVHTHQYVKAVKSLQWLRGIEEDIEDEYEELKNAVEDQSSQSMFKQKSTRKAFFITATLMAFHQLSGIYNVIMNLEEISIKIGAFPSSSVTALVIASVMLLSACVAAGVVDRLGRKILLYISVGTMSAIAFVLLACLIGIRFMNCDPREWTSFLCLMMYACAFNIGMGPLPWVIMGEVIPQKFHGSACGMVSSVGWLTCTLTTACYSLLPSVIAHYALYTFFCILGLIFIRIFVPETAGYTLEEIHAIIQR